MAGRATGALEAAMDMDGRYGLGQIFQRTQEIYLDHQDPGRDPGRMGLVLIPLLTFVAAGAVLGMVALPLWVAQQRGAILVTYALLWALIVGASLVYAVRRRRRLRAERARELARSRERAAKRAAQRRQEPRGSRLARASRIHDPEGGAQPPPRGGR